MFACNLFQPSDYLDLLIVVDEEDLIKRLMHAIKSSLKMSALKSIKCRSIFDPENEKQRIYCSKVLLLMAGKSAAQLEKKWIWDLPNIKGDSSKYLIVYIHGLNNSQSIANNSYSEEQHLHVSNVSDIFTWWPEILKFLFGFTKKQSSSKPSCDIYLTDSGSPTILEFRDQIQSVLEDWGISVGDNSNGSCSNTIVLVCQDLSQQIDEEMKMELQRRKVNNCFIFTVSTSSIEIRSADIKWISTCSYGRQERMTFMLHLLNRLQMIVTGIPPNRPSPVAGPMKISNPRPGTNTLTLTWPVLAIDGSDEHLHIHQCSDQDTQWKAIAEMLPSNISSYEVKNLDTHYQYKFKLFRETANSISEPLISNWFAWGSPNSFLFCILRVLLFFINIPMYIYFVFGAATFWFIENELRKRRKVYYFMPFGIANLATASLLYTCYGLMVDTPGSIGFLFAGTYLIVWNVIIHNITIWHGYEGGVVLLWKSLK